MARSTLAEQVLKAFRQAYRDGRFEVADRLFAVLEAMPEADLSCACEELAEAAPRPAAAGLANGGRGRPVRARARARHRRRR